MATYEELRSTAASDMASGLVHAWADEGRDPIPDLFGKLRGAWMSGWNAADHDLPCTTEGFPAEPSLDMKPLVDQAFEDGYGYRKSNGP